MDLARFDRRPHPFVSVRRLYARPDILPAPLPDGRTYRDLVGEIRQNPDLYLRAYFCSGITSVVDFGGPRWEFDLRTRAEGDPCLPRMAFTGPLLMTGSGREAPRAGGPSVLSLEDGDPFWPLGSEEEGRRQVQRLILCLPKTPNPFIRHELAPVASTLRVGKCRPYSPSCRPYGTASDRVLNCSSNCSRCDSKSTSSSGRAARDCDSRARIACS